MKKTNMILLGLFLIIGFSACQQDEIIKVNPEAINGTLGKFHLNTTSYGSNYIYALADSTSTKDFDVLTCDQPNYGFTASVKYTTQICFDSLFKENTYKSLPTNLTNVGEVVGLKTIDVNKAIIALYGGALPDPVVTKEVYFRLKAQLLTTTDTVSDNVVKPTYSNVVKLNFLPYVLPLFPYTEVKPSPWYIVGLGGSWDNSKAGLGSSLIPLSVVSGKKYNLNGDGEFVYVGHFSASTSFKIIHTPGDWNVQWGNKTTGGIDSPTLSNGQNFGVPTDGFYKLTLNTIDNTLKIVSIADPGKTTYSLIGLIGAFNSWGGDVALTANPNTGGHVWYVTNTFASDSQCKLRANGGWDVNWGTPSSIEPDPLYSYVGLGLQGGKNMIQKAGTYTVIFNDIDGCYYFITK